MEKHGYEVNLNYEANHNFLFELLHQDKIEDFISYLDSKEDDSLSIEEGDGENIGCVITLLNDRKNDGTITEFLSDNLVLKFIAKIKIDPTKDSPTDHAHALFSFINPTRNVTGLRAALQKGFDPGALLPAGHDLLEIATQQTQSNNRYGKTVFLRSDLSTAENQENFLKDIEMVKLMFRTGKISGYLGEAGIREAQTIEEIYNTGKLPEGYALQDNEDPGLATVIIGGDTIAIERQDDRLEPMSATRAYLHQFHERYTLPDYLPRAERLMAEKVSHQTLSNVTVLAQNEEDSEETPGTNILSRICETLAGCFRSNRVGDSDRY